MRTVSKKYLKKDLNTQTKQGKEMAIKNAEKVMKKDPSNSMKEKIIQSAIKKFANKGFSNTSMDEIAKESKVSKGLLFYHFNNKEELYAQALEQGIDATLDFSNKLTEMNNAKLFQKKKNLFQDLEKYYDLIVTTREKDLERLWLDGMLEARKNPKLKKILIKREEVLVGVGVQMLKAGRDTINILEGRSDEELMEVAKGLLALYKGIMLEKSIGKNPKEIKKAWVRITYSMYMTSK